MMPNVLTILSFLADESHDVPAVDSINVLGHFHNESSSCWSRLMVCFNNSFLRMIANSSPKLPVIDTSIVRPGTRDLYRSRNLSGLILPRGNPNVNEKRESSILPIYLLLQFLDGLVSGGNSLGNGFEYSNILADTFTSNVHSVLRTSSAIKRDIHWQMMPSATESFHIPMLTIAHIALMGDKPTVGGEVPLVVSLRSISRSGCHPFRRHHRINLILLFNHQPHNTIPRPP